METCPNCRARLVGAPEWCPRCLTRFSVDRAPALARTVTETEAVTPPPQAPSWYTPATWSAAPVDEPTPTPALPPTASAASTAPTGKNPITPTVVKAILLGLGMQILMAALAIGMHMEPARAITWGVVLTLVFYGAVFAMVQARLADTGLKPIWVIGEPGTALVIGVSTGAALAGLVIAVTSAIAGHLSTDAAATTVAGQGSFPLLAGIFVVMVVAAPFVEELLFRGLLAESLRPKSMGAAIWLSAFAFALWHLRPDAIRYYLLVGALLGLLYWKRGLVASMSAHATFNGLLLLVAVLSVSGGPHAVAGNGLSTMAPAGWRAVGGTGADLSLRSVSGARLDAKQLPLANADASAVLTRLQAGDSPTPSLTVDGSSAHLVHYPAGDAAVVDIKDQGHDGELVVLVTPRAVWSFEALTAGNAKALSQVDGMLQKLSLS